MAKAKSKEFILERADRHYYWLTHLNGITVGSFCATMLERHFGINFEVGKKKRVRITIKVL